MNKLKKYLIPFLLCSVFFLMPETFCANPPNFQQIQNLGMGVNLHNVNCNASGGNCGISDVDISLAKTGDTYQVNATAVPYFVGGITTSYYNGEVFVPGYIYVYTLQVYDNASNRTYYEAWSWAINTGYDSDYGGVNKYADIKRVEITKTGNNYNINIYFTVNEWTRYFRVSGRSPYSYDTTKLWGLSLDIEDTYPLMSWKSGGTFYFRYANYGFSAMTDYEYQNYIKQQEIANNTGETNNKLDDIQDNITNDNISGSQNTANGFFDNFSDNDYGLSSIITIPLSSIQKLSNSICTPIKLPVPFTGKTIDLPCMGKLYENNVPTLLNIWQVVSFGLISYAIIVDIFGMVKKFKDPNDDKLEVLDL